MWPPYNSGYSLLPTHMIWYGYGYKQTAVLEKSEDSRGIGRHHDILAAKAGIELKSETPHRYRALAGYHGDICDGACVMETQTAVAVTFLRRGCICMSDCVYIREVRLSKPL